MPRGLPSFARRSAIAVLDLVAPPACGVCGRVLEDRGAAAPVCGECDADLERFAGACCERCGEPLPPVALDTVGPDCPPCRGRSQGYDAVIALGPYEGLLRRVVLEAKRPSGVAGLAAVARLLARERGDALRATGADAVVSIPPHWRRRITSGADSAGVIAEAVRRHLGVRRLRPIARRRDTPRQRDVAPSRREANVRGAFAPIGRPRLDGMTVLLTDDVLTTGATAGAAARAIRKLGAARVVAVVAARRVARS
ncbi:MAG: double zinc ribbon domain-containing protein [Planctomycetota bacterium]